MYIINPSIFLICTVGPSVGDNNQTGGQSNVVGTSQSSTHQPQFKVEDVNVTSLAGLAPHIQISPQVGTLYTVCCVIIQLVLYSMFYYSMHSCNIYCAKTNEKPKTVFCFYFLEISK